MENRTSRRLGSVASIRRDWPSSKAWRISIGIFAASESVLHDFSPIVTVRETGTSAANWPTVISIMAGVGWPTDRQLIVPVESAGGAHAHMSAESNRMTLRRENIVPCAPGSTLPTGPHGPSRRSTPPKLRKLRYASPLHHLGQFFHFPVRRPNASMRKVLSEESGVASCPRPLPGSQRRTRTGAASPTTVARKRRGKCASCRPVRAAKHIRRL